MKIKPIKNLYDYKQAKKYLETSQKENLDIDQIKILEILMEDFERRNTHLIIENMDIEPLIDNIYDDVKNISESESVANEVLELSNKCDNLSSEIKSNSNNILAESTNCLISMFKILHNLGFSKQEIYNMSEKQINSNDK